ncbi:MAG: hypothetical protein EOO11_17405 [Chitinophagaceae bacterium]|nr:MAG: hypothetical protein EOO11_17405 [Chitinophagaceae bacterium]
MKLITALRSEILKTKRTASIYFTLIGAAAVPLILLLNMLVDNDVIEATRKDPLNGIFKLASEINGMVFFPVFVILVCTLLPQIEYRNNTWKQVFASPQKKGNVFLAKFFNINLLIVLFLVANLVFMWLVLVAVHFLDPALDLLHRPFDAKRQLLRTGNAYITILALCAFQFWLGLRFRNFIVPCAIGVALWLTATMMTMEFKSSLMIYFPYSFQIFPLMPRLQGQVDQVAWTSLAYALLFLTLGFFDFRRRRLTA